MSDQDTEIQSNGSQLYILELLSVSSFDFELSLGEISVKGRT